MSSSSISFRDKLEARISSINSLLCVGLDPHLKELFPDNADAENYASTTNEDKANAAFTFCKTLIEQTKDYAVCYKPNAAFFEALGPPGVQALIRVCRDEISPLDIPILLDVKRGDIGSTATAYAQSAYDIIGADAVTLSPLMGWDSISPFVTETYSDKGAFLLCKTSNPGSNELMTLNLADGNNNNNETVYNRIAKCVGTDWSERCNSNSALLGLVVGATDPVALKRVRDTVSSTSNNDNVVWILAPGVGAQGGNLEESLRCGLNSNGTGMLIPVSRGISRAENPSQAAKQLMEQINTIREQIVKENNIESNNNNSNKSKTTTTKVELYQKEFIEFCLQQNALKFGSFTLKSGRTSPYFFNAGLFSTGASLFKLGKAYASTIMNSKPTILTDGNGKVCFDVVFGPAYKGISLGAVVCSALYSDYGVDVGFAYNRKEAKDHGEGGTLVGASMEGKRILIVDDVITAGTAIRESYGLLQQIKAQPVGVVIALDRAEIRSLEDRVSAVQAVSRDLKLSVVSIVNLPQLHSFLEGNPNYSEDTLKSVAAYRQEFGVEV